MKNKEQNEYMNIIHGSVYNIYDESKAGWACNVIWLLVIPDLILCQFIINTQILIVKILSKLSAMI